MVLRELNASQFNAFINNYPNDSIYQTEQYGNALIKQKYNSSYYGLEENGKLYGASLILIEKRQGFKYAYAPRGFLIDYTNFDLLKTFTSLIKKELGKKGVIAIKINPSIIKETYDTSTDNISSNDQADTIFTNLTNLGYYHLGYNNFFEAFKPRFEAIVNLNKPVEQLFNNLDNENKEKVINSDNSGLLIFKSNNFNPDYLFLDNNSEAE